MVVHRETHCQPAKRAMRCAPQRHRDHLVRHAVYIGKVAGDAELRAPKHQLRQRARLLGLQPVFREHIAQLIEHDGNVG